MLSASTARSDPSSRTYDEAGPRTSLVDLEAKLHDRPHAILFIHDNRLTLRTDEDVVCFDIRNSGWTPRQCPTVPTLRVGEWRHEDVRATGIDPELKQPRETIGYLAK